MSEYTKIYLIGICGTGMAALAAMLQQSGRHVLGADEAVYPPMSTFLEQQSIPVLQGFDAGHLAEHAPDLVIVGNALSRGNPEVEYVLNEKIPYLSMPAALAHFFLRDRYSCVVTGTHGKTTTSSLLAWILQHAELQPGFFIAGIPENFGRGFQLGAGRQFVSEGDEYDSAFFDKGPKFLHYRPDLAIINNIEYDHADIYENLDQIKTAFRRFINIIPGRGHIIANADDPVVSRLVDDAFSNTHLFGLTEAATWRAVDIRNSGELTHFSVYQNDARLCEIASPMMGEHNIRNVLAALTAAVQMGVSVETVREAVRSFRGVRRRMSMVSDAADVLVFEDFAHHPTAVRETLNGARRRFPDRRLWAIFEPRTASAKRKVFQERYYDAFDAADRVLIAPMHRPDKVPASERLSVAQIAAELNARRISARYPDSNDALLATLERELEPGDVVVFMSNGAFDGVPDRLGKQLQHKQEA